MNKFIKTDEFVLMEESESGRIFLVAGPVLCCQRGLLSSTHPLHVGVVWVP
jgi:hypothetical protein